MGVSCCTHQKDAPEIITIVEPEKNINMKKREDILVKENQQNNLIIVNPNENNIMNSNDKIIPINDSKINNMNNPNRIINLENPLDINTMLESEISNKNPLEFDQKKLMIFLIKQLKIQIFTKTKILMLMLLLLI